MMKHEAFLDEGEDGWNDGVWMRAVCHETYAIGYALASCQRRTLPKDDGSVIADALMFLDRKCDAEHVL